MGSVGGYRVKGERERVAHKLFNQSNYFLFFFFLNKKANPLREECRHQIEGVREFKRGVDVARADWPCVREGTPLRGECPSHPKIANIGGPRYMYGQERKGKKDKTQLHLFTPDACR
ncbi:hypothetical protein HanRHA438_Chr12g0550271 [Helianthus annuus]|uniref:Uncharacterized protein n=1 Tax=Helianthus annuus TaxID=4232 RepID=A0A251T1A6_HELAN|nr:uncharacterized protein LOC110894760 [Helianthus annuus]KAF5777743.1 hypothetical protein HanXRQr2_Chr12g0539331 [Helianthus annuus]KAJ0489236.1 hypothetical protein HanHA300_Chr12g0441751 [Helianthus annuus]KAJ0492980.1 hypothetical protein HanIR_Chr12g0580951 [Helianthus annuus]KAJ0505116.1 hypothetical protein HanHA89_Chr12g0466881 [Helianthus annuus]KAJ0674803.1 hypothetical protein HanLR1_Chr12g0444031 [Helianthus annuus]